MDRIIRLTQIWSWLPAFRAVAETEHLHRAAALVHLTPSTLSRAVRLLEDDLGCALFRRVGRSMELTDDGQELLLALRDAMRRLDDAVVAVTGAPTAPLRIAADDAVALATLIRVGTAAETPAPELSPAGDDAVARLLRGSVDLALVTAAAPRAHVVVTCIGDLRYSVHCAPTHPFAGLAGTREALETQPFIDAPGLPWPPERPRTVALRVGGAALAVAACRAGAGLAMLPDAAGAGLVRLRDSAGVPLASLTEPVFALCRRPLEPGSAVDVVIAMVRAQLEQSVRELAMDRAAAGA